jgi:hypothetical protein
MDRAPTSWEATEDGDFICRIWGTLITPYTDRIRDGKRLSQERIRPYREVVGCHFRAALEQGEPYSKYRKRPATDPVHCEL